MIYKLKIFTIFSKKAIVYWSFENYNKKEYNKIYKFIGAKEDNSINYSRISRKGEYNFELSIKNKKYLYNFYKNHNEKLYEILGYKINEWEDYYKKKIYYNFNNFNSFIIFLQITLIQSQCHTIQEKCRIFLIFLPTIILI